MLLGGDEIQMRSTTLTLPVAETACLDDGECGSMLSVDFKNHSFIFSTVEGQLELLSLKDLDMDLFLKAENQEVIYSVPREIKPHRPLSTVVEIPSLELRNKILRKLESLKKNPENMYCDIIASQAASQLRSGGYEDLIYRAVEVFCNKCADLSPYKGSKSDPVRACINDLEGLAK